MDRKECAWKKRTCKQSAASTQVDQMARKIQELEGELHDVQAKVLLFPRMMIYKGNVP